MKRHALTLVAFICIIFPAFSQDVNILEFRFSIATIEGIKKPYEAQIFSGAPDMPHRRYDKESGKYDYVQLLQWLDQNARHGSPIPKNRFETLKQIILSPDSHRMAAFAIGGDYPRFVVSFSVQDQQGYILVRRATLTIIFGNRYETTLLSDEGRELLDKWVM